MQGMLFYPDKCDLCRKCEIACTEKIRNFRPDEAPSAPHIRMFVSPVGPVARICHHCEEPPCVDACIGESLYSADGGTVCQHVDRCVGCFMCNMVCPHGSMKTVMSKEKAFKCTLMCGKTELPTCVFACDRGALYFEELRAHNNKIRRNKIKELPHK